MSQKYIRPYLYSMSNKIRSFFAREVAELLPVLHATYRLIGIYQREDSQHATALTAQLEQCGTQLAFLKSYVQAPKQPYFDAILAEDLLLRDRIIALDTAVGAMHIEFNMPRAYMHRESEALRAVLAQARQSALDEPISSPEDGALLQGIGAAPGTATGKAYHVRRPADFRRMPSGSIVIARMTRPEIIVAIEKISGIVTDIGGSLCHAAILAREYRIPCVVGTGQASQIITPRTLVRVDGQRGCVEKVR